MKKMIIIDDNKRKRKRIIENRFIEWLLYMLGYAIVLIVMSILFKSLYISSDYYGLYALLGAIIIYVLNQTIKPIVIYLTLPITALTLGLFYPLINVLILYITSFILGNKFNVEGIVIPFFIAILISFMNALMEGLIIKPIINKKDDKNGKNSN